MDSMHKRPNILLFVLDAVRAKNVSAYGYAQITTPILDSFAGEGIFFRRAFTNSTWTIPTHASLLSGLYLSEHKIESIKGDRRFNHAIVTLPEALKSHQYRTAAISQNRLFSPKHHLDGFDQFFEINDLLDNSPVTRTVNGLFESPYDLLRVPAGYIRKIISLPYMLDFLGNWIETNGEEQPYFLMVNIANAHYPWAPPLDILFSQYGLAALGLLKRRSASINPFHYNSGLKQVTREQCELWHSYYDAAIMHIDREIGKFFERFRRLDRQGNSIIIITADHGEMLGEHHNIVGHTLCLHDNLIHVPLLISHPDYPKGLVVEDVVQTLDLFPSLLEWADIPNNSVHEAQVKRPRLSSAISNPGSVNGLAFAEEDYTDSYNLIDGLLRVNPNLDPKKYPHKQVAVRSANHKYVWFNDRPAEFYDLSADPEEANNIVQTRDGANRLVLQELAAALNSWTAQLDEFPPESVAEKLVLDDKMVKRLRDLGYVD